MPHLSYVEWSICRILNTIVASSLTPKISYFKILLGISVVSEIYSYDGVEYTKAKRIRIHKKLIVIVYRYNSVINSKDTFS